MNLQNAPLVWAHQGASGHAPANTLEAFHLAVAMGADVLETDVQATQDGVLVLCHDNTVDRLTNGRGSINAMSLAQLRELDAGHHTPGWRGKGVRIPTLDDFLAEFAPLDGGRLRFSIDMKTANPPLEERVWAAIRRHGVQDRTMVGSFYQSSIDIFRRLSGGRVATAGAPGELYRMAALWKTGLGALWHPDPTLKVLAIPTRAGPLRTDTPSLTRLAHSKGLTVQYWTINDEAEMRHLLQIGADGICTDYPDRAVRVMQEMGLRW